MILSRTLAKVIPPHVSEELQAWMILVGVCGIIVAPLLPTRVAIMVINEVSMVTLVVAGIAGLDAVRTQPSRDDE